MHDTCRPFVLAEVLTGQERADLVTAVADVLEPIGGRVGVREMDEVSLLAAGAPESVDVAVLEALKRVRVTVGEGTEQVRSVALRKVVAPTLAAPRQV
jgi:hypothetical protein